MQAVFTDYSCPTDEFMRTLEDQHLHRAVTGSAVQEVSWWRSSEAGVGAPQQPRRPATDCSLSSPGTRPLWDGREVTNGEGGERTRGLGSAKGGC